MKKKRFNMFTGIKGKMFRLILITVILVALLFSALNAYRNEIMSQQTTETQARQVQSMTETATSAMTEMARKSLTRITELEAQATDEFFRDAQSRVVLLAQNASQIFAEHEYYSTKLISGPDPSLDGELVAQVIPAPGVDPNSPEYRNSLRLTSNMAEIMLSVCNIFDTDNVYIATPEGVFLSVSRSSASWFREDGSLLEYDARTRFWYKQAVEAGDLIFTDVEVDANTGNLSLVCAIPVYGSTGKLKAVIGTDLFLNTMQESMRASESDGDHHLVINRNGQVVASTTDSVEFQVQASENAVDLRQSPNQELADFVREALAGQTDLRLVHLDGGSYYMVGTPVNTVGWIMISLFDEEKVMAPAITLQENYEQIESEAATAYSEKNNRLNVTVIVVLAVLLIVLSAFALLQGKRIVKPLNKMTKRISELHEDQLDFRMEDEYRTGDEVEILAESFAMMTRKTTEYVEQVRTVTAEKERISAELNMAATIQNSMLPQLFPPFPDRKEFDLYAAMDPAKEVGGDFYDFFLVDPDHLCLVIADVSGKGIPAALFMMTSKVILQNCALMGIPPGEILAKTNDAICANNQAEMFVTIWVGILEISTGKLTFANAGHEYPALKRAGGSFELVKDKHSFVIGGMPGLKYAQHELQLNPGDKLFLYTDGVPEATSAEKELFGNDRMLDALNEAKDAAPKELLQAVRKSVDEFVKEAEQFDDLTMLGLEYKGV